MDVSLAARTQTCQNLFEKLSKALTERQTGQDGSEHIRVVAVEECISRFRIWSTNLGAHHAPTDLRSIDHRLRNVPSVTRHLSEVLTDLQDTLHDSLEISTGQRQDQSISLGNATFGSIIDWYDVNEVLEADPEQKIPFRPSEEDDGGVSELGELLSALPDLISGLFKISILIRKSTNTDRYRKSLISASYVPFNTEFDIGHVGEKFPKTRRNWWLQERLGNAISQRRQYLRYSRDHHNRIGRGEQQKPFEQETTFQSQRPTTTYFSRASLAPTAATSVATSDICKSIHVQDLDREYDDVVSQASSNRSSKVSEICSDRAAILDIHEVRNDATEFECPYCWGIVTVEKQRSWRKHVFRDLRAYVCTFQDCNAGLFEDRETWFRHEMETHRSQLFCVICHEGGFMSKDLLSKHLLSNHGRTEQEFGTAGPLANVFRLIESIAASSCPLCDDWAVQLKGKATKKGNSLPPDDEVMVSLPEFKRHLAGHQKELALFAIPPVFQEPEGARSAPSAGGESRSNKLGQAVFESGNQTPLHDALEFSREDSSALYQPLNSNDSVIRLARLLPGLDDATIELQLECISLSEATVLGYEALTYKWGDMGNRKVIYVDGNYLSVGAKLAAFLVLLRKPELTRLLWIDSICINQDDLQEKSQQIAIMDQIYSGADRVLIWRDEAVPREMSWDEKALRNMGFTNLTEQWP
ncbi:hypothetical protein D0863_05892 [Hortaea werneckii]|uniref:Uncharacterized protein n=1 Tax=Hortaea werneckii TaxID=91943 RepID=A0A3M7E0Q1_HORWE|nr:hypothetical protein D0863_05892 [Hortaea werneckii]